MFHIFLCNIGAQFQAKTLNGDVLSNQFENLTPGTEYVVSVWAKVMEGDDETLSLAGLANGATSKTLFLWLLGCCRRG